jgi:prolyl 4-hydroxylase
VAALLLLPLLLQALWYGTLYTYLPSQLLKYVPGAAPSQSPSKTADVNPEDPALLSACKKHTYTTEIISLSPLVIYINNFTSAAEAESLIALGEPDFEDSFISRSHGPNKKVTGRTSSSAPLELSHPLVSCIIARARRFMGTTLQPHEPFSTPQLVRYYPSQRYDLHTDFWPQHQRMNDGSGRLFNRVASFFVFLRDNCTQGETYFPAVDVLDKDAERDGGLEGLFGGKVARGGMEGQENGVKFRPIRGNAVFWVNIGQDGVGDRRVVHAGLPVGDGEKIGLNLWPRKFFMDE